MNSVPLSQIFTFFLLMLGPFKVIGPFGRVTRGAAPPLRRQIAINATLVSTLALLVAAAIGESILRKYGIPLAVLTLAAGIILFLVALLNVLKQFAPPTPSDEAPEPTVNLAISPMAFPTIVTPYGIAAVIVFMALEETLNGKLVIGALILAIMVLNLIGMLLAHSIPRIVALLLQVLGAVLGIIQVALGLQIILNSLRLAIAGP